MQTLANLITIITFLLLLAFVGVSFGYRAGVDGVELATVFGTFKTLLVPSLVAGILTVITGLVGLLKGRGFAAILALLLGAGALGAVSAPMKMHVTLGTVPPIHDITTDTDNPPAFVDIVPLRATASNPPEYDIDQTNQQIKAYPEIKTLVFNNSYEDVYAASIAAVLEMKLNIVTANKKKGRIEATHTSLWFGFKDDVVIRIAPGPQDRIFVDIRSKSRVGKSDLGKNAERITKLSGLIKVALSQ